MTDTGIPYPPLSPERLGEMVTHRGAMNPATLGELIALADEVDAHRRAVEGVRRAIVIAGPQPSFHDFVMARHRREWPTLWAAIDELLGLDPHPHPGRLNDFFNNLAVEIVELWDGTTGGDPNPTEHYVDSVRELLIERIGARPL